MTDRQAVVALLDETRTTSRHMLDLAQAGEWDALIECEQARRSQIAALRDQERAGLLVPEDGPDREAILAHIHAILEADQLTGALVKAWMTQLSQNLGELDMARKVSAAYGAR